MQEQSVKSKRLAHLMRSSLPLEHLVGLIAKQSGFINGGEFSYGRENELGRLTDFSVDLLVVGDSYANSDGDEVHKFLNVLIECKYASPSVAWVFSSAPGHTPLFMSAFSPFACVETYRLEGLGAMQSLEPERYCSKGISLSDHSADPTQVQHGVQQLRFAIPRLLESLCDYCVSCGDPTIPIIAPILVTNAPLYVLRDDIDLNVAESAAALADLACPHAHLCVFQQPGPELIALCRSTAARIVEKYPDEVDICSADSLADDLMHAVETVTVVSLKYLPDYLASLRSVVSGLAATSREQWSVTMDVAQAANDGQAG